MNNERESGRRVSPFSPPFYMLFLTVFFTSTLFVVNAAATREMWPWVAYIPSLKCTGAIVDSRWLLTASRCFRNKSTIPSELFIEIQNSANEGKSTSVGRIYVIDYTRDESLYSMYGLTMLYLARTIPSMTREVVSLRGTNSTFTTKRGIVLSWDSVITQIGFETSEIIEDAVNIIALSVDVSSCVDDSARFCASLDKHLSTTSGVALYCSRINLGSPLVLLDNNGGVSLLGILHERSDCQTKTQVLARFVRVDRAYKWIRQQFRVQDFPQCQPNVYRNLDSSLRDLRNDRSGPSVLCDTNIPRAWYRFTLQGQPAELPTSCPEANKCGSSSTVWLPQADVLEIGKQVEVKSCATWTIGQRHMCCFWKLSIFVRHCGDFKVYRLRRTDACPTSYCTNVTKGYCGRGKTGYKPNCKDSYPKLPKTLHFYPFFAHQGRPKKPYVYLRCIMYPVEPRNQNIKYFFSLFKLDKRPDGKLAKQTIRTFETSRSYCDTLFLPKRYNVALGDTVVCEVTSFFVSTKETRSPSLISDVRHLGIEVHPSSTTTLTQFQDLLITFVVTLPVICPGKHSNCSLTIPLTTSLSDASSGTKVDRASYFTLSKCSLVFTPERCNRRKADCGKETILLKAGRNLRHKDLRLNIKLGPVLSSDAVWKDTNFPTADVILKPTPHFTCYAMSSSNIKTFDGSFLKHLGEGTFVLYNNTSPSIQVEIRKWRCHRMSTCPCAVAVREGNDVIIADMCSGQYKQTSLRIIVRSKSPLHQLTRVIESNDGKTFTITFQSGFYVKVDEFEWGISIFLATTDHKESTGLCRGLNMDGTSHNKFSRKIKDSDSLFYTPVHPLNPSPNKKTNTGLCACSGLKSLNVSMLACPPPTVRFPLDFRSLDVTQKITNHQKVLQTNGYFRSKSKNHVKTLQADSPSRSMTDAQRKEFCNTILGETGALSVCKDVLGRDLREKMQQICLQDTEEGFDLALVNSNGIAITRLCQQKLQQHKDSESLIRKWKLEFCENRCGKNGECNSGSCKCKEGYGSSDCSVSLNTPPKIFPLEDPVCDHRYDICEEVFISGTPFVNSAILSCSFTPVQRTSNIWKEQIQGKFIAKALFYSSRGVICVIPKSRRSFSDKSNEAFYIRISNNGDQWSNPVLRIIHDSLCKNCTDSGHCLTKADTCDIDSRCFIQNDIHPDNDCLKCSTERNPHQWSSREDNLPPTFISPAEHNITVFIDELVTFVVKATDPENRPLEMTHDVSQANLTVTGEFHWRPKEEEKRTIRLVATDECGRSTAKYVDVNVRRCLCRNGGKCPKTTDRNYQCLCPVAFQGRYCERQVLPCFSNPCVRGTCNNTGQNFRCLCDAGYRGNRCQLKIPACESNPCMRGSCKEISSGFQCKCPRFYDGRLCETDIGPCAKKSCIRGTCKVINESSFECICPEGFHGKLCSQRRTPCSPNPCHNGRCVVVALSIRCICPPTFHGKFCNLTRAHCNNKPCVHGVCESTMNGQRCVCQRGFTGEKCDVTCTIDCVNGQCVNDTRGITCVCHEGYTGPDCNVKRTSRSCETNPCAHGLCIDQDDGFLCRCHAGYSGPLCNISACSQFYCVNGTCILANGVPLCRCFEGFVGNHCDRRRHPCDSNPCFSGLCIVDHSSFKCSCNPGYQGLLCDLKTDPCSPNPCENGLCKENTVGKFSCACHRGYTGPLCKQKQNPCFSNPCVHGTCMIAPSGNFRCKCDSGYIGVQCEKRFNICSSNPCVNGRCFSVYEGTFFCSCGRGFTGTFCEIDRRPCSRKPCFKGVSCTNYGDTYRCGKCPVGFVGNGVHCRPDKIPSSTSGFPCPRQFCFPGVDCSIVASQIHCGNCPHGYYGNGFNCQVLCKNVCLNGGTCVKPGVCRCPPGFTGAACSRAECETHCLNGGRCIPPNRCQCPRGYTGLTCEQAVCPSPCLNGGQCIKPGICLCSPGYFGARCQEGTCFPQCRNGGICVRNNVCACPKGYRGNRCQTAVCRRPCLNGGRCFEKDRCSCPYGYWGDTCQYVTCLRPCLNGGVCIKPSVCLCPKDYAGLSCEIFVG